MTKKAWKDRVTPCSLPDCPWEAEFRVYDEKARLVRMWCSVHHDEYIHGVAERAWEVKRIEVLHGGTDHKVDSSSKSSRQVPNDNDTRGDPAPHGVESGRPGNASDERRLVTAPPRGSGSNQPSASGNAGYPPAEIPPPAPAVSSLAYWQGAGEISLTPEAQALLWEPTPHQNVAIRPDGIVYLPWAHVWRTILRAFSPQVPALVWLGKPQVQNQTICLHVVMVVGGKFIGEAVGECRYRPGNQNMSWASCVEGAQSDAIVKISKRLGMYQELWSVPWVNAWRAEYALRVYRTSKREYQWRRIDDEPFYDEGKEGRSSESEYSKPRSFDDDAREHMDSLEKDY
jgi:hypothetical protein